MGASERELCCTRIPGLGLKLAPINIPLARRLQTFAVLFWLTWFFFAGPLGLWLVIYSALYTQYWPLTLGYLLFILYDFDTMNRGGRTSWTARWVRNWELWKHFCDYFPIKLVRTATLDPSKNYLLGYHPHGVLCVGAVGVFATERGGFRELFPGIECRLLTLSVQFWFPLYRELVYCMGGACASKRGIESLLLGGKGKAAVLVPGGAKESLNGEKDKIRLVLNSRKGFIKIALQTGASLVPTFSFGEHRTFNLVSNPPGSRLRRIQDWFLSKSTVPLFFYMGRGVFQYSLGYLPFRQPIHVVIGSPITVTQTDCPTPEQVDSLHGEYVAALKDLYTEYNPKYGEPGVQLIVE